MDAHFMFRFVPSFERICGYLLFSCLKRKSLKFVFCCVTTLLFTFLFSGILNVQVNAATSRTKNFIVQAGEYAIAQKVGLVAERYREDLAVLWLGKKLPNWSRPCVITVNIGEELEAGGETVFSFSNGEVYDWKMRIQGRYERIFDSVLPHEITHTIMASYLRSPVPRWLDEGMATAVEADVERTRYRKMLATFLHSKRGIAFNDMVSMKDYPDDLTPFYSQSFSICEYLISVGGHQRLAEFAKYGNEVKDWNLALQKYYDCNSLGALQTEWIGWVHEWDVANQPVVLPKTRKIADYEDSEFAVALSDETGMKRSEVGEFGKRIHGFWNGLVSHGHSEGVSPKNALVSRAQSQDALPADNTHFLNSMEPHRGWESSITALTHQGGNAGAFGKTLGDCEHSLNSNTQALHFEENILSNGAGSASGTILDSPTNLESTPVYYRPVLAPAF